MNNFIDKYTDWIATLAIKAKERDKQRPLSQRFLYAILLVLSFIAALVVIGGVAVGSITAVIYLLSLAFGLGPAVFITVVALMIMMAAAVIVGS